MDRLAPSPIMFRPHATWSYTFLSRNVVLHSGISSTDVEGLQWTGSLEQPTSRRSVIAISNAQPPRTGERLSVCSRWPHRLSGENALAFRTTFPVATETPPDPRAYCARSRSRRFVSHTQDHSKASQRSRLDREDLIEIAVS